MRQRASGAGMRLTWRWDIVGLGRLAGAFVIASGLGLAIWSALQFEGVGAFGDRFFRGWYMFVSIAWGGAAIILLAELVNRLAGLAPHDGG